MKNPIWSSRYHLFSLSPVNELLKQLDVANDLSPIQEKEVCKVVGKFSDVLALMPKS